VWSKLPFKSSSAIKILSLLFLHQAAEEAKAAAEKKAAEEKASLAHSRETGLSRDFHAVIFNSDRVI
jgi:hypothetical protein